ncbi:MAG: hypothetical protein A2494_00120 [Candidatus Lloydbacteria bacterium RIFOXYC12_FULL_46_25]|uniref:Transglycosylase SLT domain-containing protein n=1 Tax=Candidatus Lloydbacteria bacterium RIFOXYC12_FULL_46_25 TaxID=1798670 RepID=A0A1G2E0R1_9BACT|nr:MAG: hypothetical protein A2494_00120 [Candidatus Lloydbacteria bacterium RIFOXYC12_FULL_46_25]
MKILSGVLLIGLLFAPSLGGAEVTHPIKEWRALPPPPTRAEYVLKKVAEADELCADQKLSFITEEGKVTTTVFKNGKNGKRVKRRYVSRVNRIVARPVYLCAFKESDQTWHVVKVFVKYPVPATYEKFPAWVSTEGYEIKHVAGRGIARLTFDLSQQGERLTIYRYRHAWFTKDPLKHTAHEIISSARAINYTPYQSDFRDKELRDVGANFLRSELDAVFTDLLHSKVFSRAYPAKLVSEVIHPKQPMILAAIEQTDDGRFIADPEEATNAIFIEYALNRGRAFNWSVSSANAIGALQFTNKNGNGTYDLVVRSYPNAHIHPDFEDGTRDLRNVLKAAICLLDLELAQLSEVQDLYLKNPKLGGIYPVAAYNEGGGGARQLYDLITKHNVDLGQDEIELPKKFFERVRRIVTLKKKKTHVHAKSVMNHETHLYIKKYMYVWKYLDGLPPTHSTLY